VKNRIASIIKQLFPRENERFINDLANEIVTKYNGKVNDKNIVVALLKIMNNKIKVAASKLERETPGELYIDDPNDIHKVSTALDYINHNKVNGDLKSIESKLRRAKKKDNASSLQYDEVARMYTRDVEMRENSNYMEIDDVRGRQEEPFKRAVNPPFKKTKGDSISR